VAGEIALALSSGAEVPGWALAALDEVAGVMADGGRRARTAERAAVDVVEAAVLAGRVGGVFDATAVDARDDRVTVQIADPAVVAPLEGGAEPGERLRARLVEADPATRRVRFARAGGPA
jgi:exoribonuclease R